MKSSFSLEETKQNRQNKKGRILKKRQNKKVSKDERIIGRGICMKQILKKSLQDEDKDGLFMGKTSEI